MPQVSKENKYLETFKIGVISKLGEGRESVHFCKNLFGK